MNRDNHQIPALERLDDRTWPQLAAALRVATRTLGGLTGSSREACEALDSIDRILSDNWDGEDEPAEQE